MNIFSNRWKEGSSSRIKIFYYTNFSGVVQIQEVSSSSCTTTTAGIILDTSLLDENVSTCMLDGFDPTKWYQLKILPLHHGCRNVVIIGYNLQCSPAHGLLVFYTQSCGSSQGCSAPNHICHSQHASRNRGQQGLVHCSYRCITPSSNGYFTLLRPPAETKNERLCEIVVQWIMDMHTLW